MSAHQRTPIPVALPSLDVPLAAWMSAALNESGLRWETVLISDCQRTIEAMVAQGQAISAFPCQTDVLPNETFRRLGIEDGLPRLPDIKLVLTTRGNFVSLGAQKLRDLLLGQFSAP